MANNMNKHPLLTGTATLVAAFARIPLWRRNLCEFRYGHLVATVVAEVAKTLEIR